MCLLDGAEMSNINDAIADIENKTCVTFQASSTAAYRLNIIKGSGCYSYIGRIGSQPQELSLGPGCATYVSPKVKFSKLNFKLVPYYSH